MEEFIQRLKTFKLTTWMMKPKELSPVECARRGYINTQKDTITCTHCGAFFNSSIYYEDNLLSMHSEYCKLSTPMPLTYDNLIDFSPDAFYSREASYSNTEVLPYILNPIDSNDHEKFTAIFPGFPRIPLKSIYSLFGWTAGFSRVHCELCGIVIECSRKEYALVKARNIYNVLTGSKSGEKLSLRNVEINVGKSVDLLKGHRYYCPWINDITVEGYSYFTNTPLSENIGWKIVLNQLLQSRF